MRTDVHIQYIEFVERFRRDGVALVGAGLPHEPLSSTEYEKLTMEIFRRLQRHKQHLATERLEHNVNLLGRSGPSQIDVVWEGRVNGVRERWIFECKHYADPM